MARKFHKGGVVPRSAGPVFAGIYCPLAPAPANVVVQVHVDGDGEQLLNRLRDLLAARPGRATDLGAVERPDQGEAHELQPVRDRLEGRRRRHHP